MSVYATARRRSATILMAPLLAANVALWVTTLAVSQGSPQLLAAATLAWGLGLRHAFDGDHVAAIDSATRQARAVGGDGRGVGLAFSAGHASVVVIACGLASLAGHLLDLRRWSPSLVDAGSAVSSLFLLAIGFANLRLAITGGRGDMVSSRAVSIERHGALAMFPVGLLFALGFDTTTEIAVIGLSLQQSSAGASSGQLLLLPLLFAAGMMAADTAQGMMAAATYDRGLDPGNRRRWNVPLTAGSAVVALAIALSQLGTLLADRFGLGLTGTFERLRDDLSNAGILIALVGAASLLVMMARSRPAARVADRSKSLHGQDGAGGRT